MKKMTKKKMELLYKNLHVSYLEMVNSIFSDEEKVNPSVVKEFERFGSGIGMFVNEDPFSVPIEEKNCLGIKKLYKFQPISLEKIIETKTKMTQKEITEEKFVTGVEGQYDSKYEVEPGKGGLSGMGGISGSKMSGKVEYEYGGSSSGSKFEDSSLKKEDSKDSFSRSKYKGESKIKAKYSTKPLEEKNEQDLEEFEEEEEEEKEDNKKK